MIQEKINANDVGENNISGTKVYKNEWISVIRANRYKWYKSEWELQLKCTCWNNKHISLGADYLDTF